MALPGWLKSLRPGRRRNEPARDTQPFPSWWLQTRTTAPGRPVMKPTPQNLRYFSRTPYARRAINAIKNPIAMLEWEVAPVRGVDLNPELERQIEIVTRCLEQPNGDDSFRTLAEQVLEDMCAGAGAIEVQVSGDVLRPLWMWPTDGLSIQLFPGWTGDPGEARYAQATGYGYTSSANATPLRDDELIYIRPNPSTATPFGLGPLEVAFLSISRQLGVGEFAGNVTTNAKPSVLLDLGEGASADALTAFRSYWTNDIEGQGKTPIIASKGGDVKRLYPEGDTGLFLAYQEFLKTEIAVAFDLSPMSLGVERDVNRNCYSEDTETLTADGWRRLDEITSETMVGSYNPVTRSVEFVAPDFFHVAPYSGEMVHVHGKMTDVLVTPDHRMWVRTLRGEDRQGSGSEYSIIPASEMLGSRRFGVVSAFGNGADAAHAPAQYIVPGCACGGGVRREYPDRAVAMGDWLAFLGFFLAEGHAGNHGGRWKVNVSQNPGPTADWVDALLSRMPGFAFASNDDDSCRRWQVADKALCSHLLSECGEGSHTKRLPRWVLDLPREQMSIVYDAMMSGDGTTDKRAGRSSRIYYTASPQLRDDMQLLATYLGHRAVATSKPTAGVYRVKITENCAESVVRGSLNVSLVPYSGQVYCFSVSPHHLFVTRRNGKIAVHGNTAEVMAQRDMDHAVKPMADLLAASITRKAIQGRLGFSQLQLRFPELDAEDEGALSDTFAKDYLNNAMTPNEHRKRKGLPATQSPYGDMLKCEVDLAIQAARGAAQVLDPALEKLAPAQPAQPAQAKDQ